MGEDTTASTSGKAALSAPELAALRQKAQQALQELQNTVSQLTHDPPSWIQTNHTDTESAASSSSQSTDARFFNQYGFVQKSAFCSTTECTSMKDAMIRLVQENWFPERDGLDSFGTNTAENKARGDYFLESADRIHYFAEPSCVDPENANQLQAKFLQQPKYTVLNKAGHALHCPTTTKDDDDDDDDSSSSNPFYQYTTSDKIVHLVTDELGWQDPVVPQSMYIFKNPTVGGMVHAHQDSTFLYTTPHQSCLGLWLALDDATLENGCLWVRPGSHTEPVKRQYLRNPKHFLAATNEEERPLAESSAEPKFLMKALISDNHPSNQRGSTDGKDDWTAQDLWELGYIPVECRAGDLLVFCGTLDHLSLPNYSPHQRHTFQLHLVEGPRAGVTWSPQNWLQYPPNKPFLSLVEEQQKHKRRKDKADEITSGS